ncbi:hypothetical protein [Chroococcus sp. FPU101]|uniref:hypothetical protein n=1 Tax=Chroococcus sp. FPU101 TaxID=1974212 RepID=UPI001A8D1735|nr:hypothetical protein [Chroococcus sp. FPU101]GFE69343.1 hypothetical protein CFPU101_19530 [Chroococcus sp. FPU101]
MIEPKLIIEPSYWLREGIQLEKVNEHYLFKFTPQLQARSDELIEQSKNNLLTSQEKAELESISELAQIFTYANSILTVKLKWYPTTSENLLHNELNISVNTATRQSL